MKLKYQKKLDSIENCPVSHEKGKKVLYRCVEDPLNIESFQPQAVLLKPKYQNRCIAWGLSVFDNFDSASQTLKNLSKKKRNKYNAIAKSLISDKDGVKYCTKNKRHYTFFPESSLNLVEKFETVESHEK